jgi:hypothetical protein
MVLLKAPISPTAVNVSGFLSFTESAFVAPNILVSKTKSKFSVIVMLLQQILNCFMKLAVYFYQEKY